MHHEWQCVSHDLPAGDVPQIHGNGHAGTASSSLSSMLSTLCACRYGWGSFLLGCWASVRDDL